MLLESQYSQFKEDLNTSKPKGGANFITDFERKDMLAITHGSAVDKTAPAPIALPPRPKAQIE
jgi:hypothetical protein